MMSPIASRRTTTFALALLLSSSALSAQQYKSFESPQIRPAAISPDGSRLLVTNTPDNRIALFSLADPQQPALIREVAVGLEPVAVAFRTSNEAWVVNHLSDSVQVIDLDAGVVTTTVQLEDEPSDLVFAQGRAFVSIATRRKVSVLDAATRTVIGSIPIFGDEPRWMAPSRDGSTLFVSAHKSGNDTTIVPASAAPPQPPPTNATLPAPPSVGLIVDSEDPSWTSVHGVNLPDQDVFEVDTTTLSVTRSHSGVGTLLFGMAVHPTDGSLWVANTEALNTTRFEPNLRGHIVDHRVTTIAAGALTPPVVVDLNPNINYASLPNPSALATALAQPTDVEFEPSGARAFVAAFGTDRIGVLDAGGNVIARIEIGETPGTTVAPRRKRGPRALLHHPSAAVLYVVNRLSNSLSVVDTATLTVLRETTLVYDPTPAPLREGRGFLYDAKLSGNGTQSCAVCHVDATTDNLSWDLGDPGGSMVTVFGRNGSEQLHPMKGPLLTQPLVGLLALGALHWRGDRPDFDAFNPAFDSLLGGAQLSAADMNAFRTFVESINHPPNPNQNRDRSYATTPAGSSAEEGRVLFMQQPTTFAGLRCQNCHPPIRGSNGQIINASVLLEPQAFRVAQIRGLYKRDGKRATGSQRTAGFGLGHDGSDDDVFDFLSRPVFGGLANNPTDRRKLQSFVEAFDTGTAPTVGFGVTIDDSNHANPAVIADRDLLIARAIARDCELVARGQIDGVDQGLFYDRATGDFQRDTRSAPRLTIGQLDQLLAQNRARLTLLGVPVGQGYRIAIDRNTNAIRDRDEAPVEYGSSTTGCSGTLRTNSPAYLGNDAFGFVVEGLPAGAVGAVLVGFASASYRVLDIDVLVDPSATLTFTADARGVGATPVGVPDNPAVRGMRIFAQSVFVDACGTNGVAATRGLELVIL